MERWPDPAVYRRVVVGKQRPTGATVGLIGTVGIASLLVCIGAACVVLGMLADIVARPDQFGELFTGMCIVAGMAYLPVRGVLYALAVRRAWREYPRVAAEHRAALLSYARKPCTLVDLFAAADPGSGVPRVGWKAGWRAGMRELHLSGCVDDRAFDALMRRWGDSARQPRQCWDDAVRQRDQDAERLRAELEARYVQPMKRVARTGKTREVPVFVQIAVAEGRPAAMGPAPPAMELLLMDLPGSLKDALLCGACGGDGGRAEVWEDPGSTVKGELVLMGDGRTWAHRATVQRHGPPKRGVCFTPCQHCGGSGLAGGSKGALAEVRSYCWTSALEEANRRMADRTTECLAEHPEYFR